MSNYLGDYAAGGTIDFKFATRNTSAVPTTLSGTPAVSVYKDNSTTESTSGVTLTVDFDSRTGMNHVRIDTSSDGTFYADGSQFVAVITTGTVGGVSVVGVPVGRFTLRAQASLYPTTAGRKLDVSSGGEAGLDWANVGSPSSALNLSATTVKTLTDAPADSSGTTTLLGRLTSTRAGLLDNLDAAVSTRSTYAGADTSGTTTLLSRIGSALTITGGKVDVSDKTGFSLSSAGIQAIWDALTSALTTVGSIGKRIVDNLDAAISTRSTYAGGDTSGTTTLLSRLTSTRAGNLDNLDAAVSTRSTYAGGDTSGTTTLLSRLTSGRASNLDNLDAAVSSRLATAGYTAPDNSSIAAIKAKTDNLPDSPASQVTLQEVKDGVVDIQSHTPSPATIAEAVMTADWTDFGSAAAVSLQNKVETIITKTDALPASPAATTDIPTAADVADKVLGRNLGGGEDGGRTVQDALRFLRNKVVISGTTITIYAEDDATPAWTGTLTTNASADPITAVDPA